MVPKIGSIVWLNDGLGTCQAAIVIRVVNLSPNTVDLFVFGVDGNARHERNVLEGTLNGQYSWPA